LKNTKAKLKLKAKKGKALLSEFCYLLSFN
jgi:hypothetical protein